MDTIMSKLPNQIIIEIIKKADGGLYNHKRNTRPILTHINSLQNFRDANFSIKTSLFMGAKACGERSIHLHSIWN